MVIIAWRRFNVTAVGKPAAFSSMDNGCGAFKGLEALVRNDFVVSASIWALLYSYKSYKK
jgi:hypothetical protein